ncbi:MAG: hypothetical protein IT337_08560 [Thermomicrobiales bacterium]|nr:hypothetical protein [Thermomicrobiales bacterium]
MRYDITCLVAGERRVIEITASSAAAAVASAQLQEPDAFELLAVIRMADPEPAMPTLRSVAR